MIDIATISSINYYYYYYHHHHSIEDAAARRAEEAERHAELVPTLKYLGILGIDLV